ncbi:lanC-like protein 3 homolog [Paramacrobiotus metropolitanus]|uniref:lanC-like protein 3 homolog n=1 Tax=Paramacrobiotus metropolitanus TaxID=2943436 RepID=UPI002445DE95|nr:lanC-like protein 3 homolog [Paramacrobiotus metropolitanus]
MSDVVATSPAGSTAKRAELTRRRSSCKRQIPCVSVCHERYMENPFLGKEESFSTEPLNSLDDYTEAALGTMQRIYHHYSEVPITEPSPDVYLGTAGIAYACNRVASMKIPQSERDMLLGMGARLIQSSQKAQNFEHQGLFLGPVGVAVVAALFYKTLGDEKRAQSALESFAKLCETVEADIDLAGGKNSGDEVLFGRTGYLMGFLELWKVFPNNKILEGVDVKKIILAVLESGRKCSKSRGLTDRCPLFYYCMGMDFVGPAHGLSGIYHCLLCFPSVLKAVPGAEEDIKCSVDFVLQQQFPSGNFPMKYREDRDELIHWCHGAPGLVYMLAKAYLVWKDKKYLDACISCGNITWQKGLLRKGPGICHGIAGNGYAFILLYQLTGQVEWLSKAECFADLVLQPSTKEKCTVPDHPYSLYEGIAGTACYFADLTNPNHSSFPFSEVFIDY